MKCWIFFHRGLEPGQPEVKEILRFQASAEQLGVELDVLQPREFDLVVDRGAAWAAMYDGRPLAKPDCIIARSGAETSYFTLAVLRHFEQQGVMLMNESQAIDAVADKLRTLQILSCAELPIPKTILGKFPVDVDVVERELGFPVVVKTLKGTRGAGVLLCNDRRQFNDLADLLDGAATGAIFIFQEYVRASHGRDVRVLVVGGKAIAVMERRSTDGGFKSSISLGGHASAYAMPPAMAKLAVQAAEALDLDVAGVDILLDENGYKICEANSSPGFQALEPVCDIDVPKIVYLAAMEKLRGQSSTAVSRLVRWLRAKPGRRVGATAALSCCTIHDGTLFGEVKRTLRGHVRCLAMRRRLVKGAS